MLTIHLCAVFSIIIFLIFYKKTNTNVVSLSRYSVILLFFFALVVRIAAAVSFRGFSVDINCFTLWADRIFTHGPGAFYTEELFCDYPPGYLYVLYPIGFLRKLFSLPIDSKISVLLIKTPSLLCDIGTGYLLYHFAEKKRNSVFALFLSAIYLFQPAILVNSSLWGQVDSVFTFFLVFMCLKLMEGKMYSSYIAFGIGILLKPQMLVFTPILLCGIYEQVLIKNLTLKSFLRNLLQGCSVICGMLLLCLPFGISNCISQYANTLGSYPYASANAYNLWSLFGMNWKSQDTVLFLFSCKTWGTISILMIVSFVILFTLKSKLGSNKYPLLGAFIILNLFVFSVRMHERYMYPGLILLLLSYACIQKPGLLVAFQSFSIFHLYNTMHVLFFYDPTNYAWTSPTRTIISLGAVICACIFNYVTVHILFSNISVNISGQLQKKEVHSTADTPIFKAVTSDLKNPGATISRLDIILMLCIIFLYSLFALRDLGDRKVPETVYSWQEENAIILNFADSLPASMAYYLASRPDVRISYTWIPNNVSPESFQALTKKELTLSSGVYTWGKASISLPEVSNGGLLLLQLNQRNASPLEFVFLNSNEEIILPQNRSEYPTLFDEAKLYPTHFSFRNSMYFDEIYHARTAKEYLSGEYSYENTHPPFGKILISLGITLFGMNPFGWRIIGTIFGIAMLPLLYLFGKQLTKSTLLAASACSIFAFDFMHFTQTRIATIDVFVTFFIIAMYYFMFIYLQNFTTNSKHQGFIFLALSGFCMGFGIATKWTAVYAGAGLAFIFFTALFLEYSKCPTAARHTLRQRFKLLLPSCVLFFVVIPCIIYLLSYIPFRDGSGHGLFQRMIDNQKAMYSYHSSLEATHYFSSPFYSWPLILKPIWYYSGILDGNLREGISSFGNPLVWWVGIPAFLHLLVHTIRKKDTVSGFLVIAYLAQYLPWMLVSRLTFIYHYFSCVPFVVLMIIYSFYLWKDKLSPRFFRSIIIAYTLAVLAMFLLYYPVLSGQPIDGYFVKEHLRLMKDWILVSM